MKLKGGLTRTLVLLLCSATIAACTYNPLVSNNHTTGSAAGTAIGAGVGAGSVALLGGTRSMILLGGLGGGAVGYYLTTLRSDASGIYQAGGSVYTLGDYLGIYIPTDHLFEPNTAEFLPQASNTLNSVVEVLQRKPDNNIMISGSTSGFSRPLREQKLSERRAKAVAAYLWASGILQFKNQSNDLRKLNYVGYGDYFPIASDHTNNGIRANSRIQITSYPCDGTLHERGNEINMTNIAAQDDSNNPSGQPYRCGRSGTGASDSNEVC